jgi:hypothetical protein
VGAPLKRNVMPLVISMKVRFLKNVTIIFSLLISGSSIVAQPDRIGTFQYRRETSGHVARLIFRTRSFDSAKNKVGYDDKIGNTVNGRKAYGAESVPKAEITSFIVFFDGERVQVPRQLYSDCYDPNFGNEYIKLSFSRDFSKLSVSMSGSDGAGGYEVVWVIRRNGRAFRFFKPAF